MLARLASDLAELCFPSTCAHCRQECGAGVMLCTACDAALAALELEPACEFCARPIQEPGAPCPWCHRRGMAHFERVVRLGLYEEPLASMIIAMKYHHRWTLAEQLGMRLFQREPVKALLSGTDVLVPVPLHWRRQVARGFNQAEVLAKVLARHAGIPLRRPVRRSRATLHQTLVTSSTQRQVNVRHAFRLARPNQIAGKHVVLVDDVMTTGATLTGVARTLRPARPASISAIVLAVADPRHGAFTSV